MNTHTTIGIIAGAGPFAGLDLIKKILEQTKADSDQDHLNVVSIFKPSEIIDRTEYLLDPSLPNPGLAIANQALELESMGASIVAIPCNTAHARPIFDVINSELKSAGSTILFLNMVEETVEYVKKFLAEKRLIGILSTTGTYTSSIYPNYLDAENVNAVVPDSELQEKYVHPAIYSPDYGVKSIGRVTEKARQNLLLGVKHLISKGADAIVLGCTEIPLAIPETSYANVPMIDPTLILARALITNTHPEKLKPII